MSTVNLPQIEVWTPEIARHWLAHPAPGQRSLFATNAALYRRRMEQGRWAPEYHAPVLIMEDGTLGNGHHRCKGMAALPDWFEVPMLVVRDVPLSVLPDVDTARPRSLAHAFGYEFPDSHGDLKAIASLTGILIASKPGRVPRVDIKPDPIEAIEFASKHLDRLIYVTSLAKAVSRKDSKLVGGIATPRTLGWLLWHLYGHPEIEAYWNAYVARTYPSTDPRTALVSYYSLREFALPTGAMSRQVTLQRMADLAGVWHASHKKCAWKPWDTEAETFMLPETYLALP